MGNFVVGSVVIVQPQPILFEVVTATQYGELLHVRPEPPEVSKPTNNSDESPMTTQQFRRG